MKRLDLWNVVGWLMVALAFALAAAGFVAALVAWPVPTGVGSALAVSHFVAWWVPNRGLRAELEAARKFKAAGDGTAVRHALAEVGSVGDKAFAHQALVAALLGSWGEHDPDADTSKAAGGMATELLWHLEGQGCRVIVPGREPAVPEEIEVEPFMPDSGYQPPVHHDVHSLNELRYQLNDEPAEVQSQPFVQLQDGRWW